MQTEFKDIPTFKDEDDERAFWAVHNSTEYIDWDQAEDSILPVLKPSTMTIALCLPEIMFNKLRLIAHKRDVTYQSLIKFFLEERIDHELKGCIIPAFQELTTHEL